MKFPRTSIFYDTSAATVSHDSGDNSFVDETILAWKGEKQRIWKNSLTYDNH